MLSALSNSLQFNFSNFSVQNGNNNNLRLISRSLLIVKVEARQKSNKTKVQPNFRSALPRQPPSRGGDLIIWFQTC